MSDSGKIVYTEKDISKNNELPGKFPFTRGPHEKMYASKLWTMRQYAGFGDAKASNERYRYLLSQGITGLSVAFDLPTQMGYDSDHPFAKGEVGRVGVAINHIEDMKLLFDQIPMEEVSTSMTINSTAAILLCLYIATAEERGFDRGKLRGTIQNDILKEYIARGTYIFPPKPSLKLTADIFDFCKKEVPQWNTISISGYHIREAGSTAEQEIAFTLSNGLTYVQTAIDKGLDIDDFAPRLSFFFNVHNNFLEEIAKFRAARRLWAKLIEERYHPKNPKSAILRFHAQTAGSTLIAQQVDTNVCRVTLQCLAAALGGAQSIHTNSRDEALGLPTQEAATLALRTQQVIAHETDLSKMVDPFGGSFGVEAWTDRLEADALGLIQKIEKQGGVVACIEKEFQQDLIQQAAYDYQREIESAQRIVVGMNKFQEKSETKNPVFSIDGEIEKNQVQRLQAFRAARDVSKVEKLREKLKIGASEDSNLVPVILESVKSGVTLGEISETLTSVWGRYKG